MITILVILLLFNLFVICFSNKVNFSINILRIILFSSAIILAIIAFCIEPYWDLEENFRYIKAIDYVNQPFISMIFKSFGQRFIGYQYYVFFYFICYIAVAMGNYHIVPFVMVLIVYCIYSYIATDWLYHHKAKYNIYVPSVFLCTVFIPFYLAVTGMRNSTAASITSLALYLFYIKGLSWWKTSILIIVSALIHPITILALPFMFLAKQKLTLKQVLVIIVILLFVPRLFPIFANSSNPFFSMLGIKMLHYTSNQQFVGGKVYLVSDLVALLLILIALCIVIYSKYLRKENSTEFERFVILYTLFIIGNIGNYDLVLRPSYLFGCLTPVIIYDIVENNWFLNKTEQIILKNFLMIVFCILGVLNMRDYIPYMLDHL